MSILKDNQLSILMKILPLKSFVEKSSKAIFSCDSLIQFQLIYKIKIFLLKDIQKKQNFQKLYLNKKLLKVLKFISLIRLVRVFVTSKLKMNKTNQSIPIGHLEMNNA